MIELNFIFFKVYNELKYIKEDQDRNVSEITTPFTSDDTSSIINMTSWEDLIVNIWNTIVSLALLILLTKLSYLIHKSAL